jgi:hypothetical protein
MSAPTLVSIRQRELGDRSFHHGTEIEPGLLEDELLDWWLDHGWAREVPERRSLFRLLHRFSGCAEREPLTQQEVSQYALAS